MICGAMHLLYEDDEQRPELMARVHNIAMRRALDEAIPFIEFGKTYSITFTQETVGYPGAPICKEYRVLIRMEEVK